MNNYDFMHRYYNYVNNNYNIPSFEHNIDNIFDPYNGFIRGNMFPRLYNSYRLDKPIDIKPANEQAEILTYIDAYSFALKDLNLYLDTNPDDKEAFSLFKKYRGKLNEYLNIYEEKYGPLKACHANNSWSWINSPWPWEVGE